MEYDWRRDVMIHMYGINGSESFKDPEYESELDHVRQVIVEADKAGFFVDELATIFKHELYLIFGKHFYTEEARNIVIHILRKELENKWKS